MEYKLLTYLLDNAGRVVTKDELLKNVWEDEYTNDGTISVHIRHTREKIESDLKNVQIDRWRSASTDGIEIEGKKLHWIVFYHGKPYYGHWHDVHIPDTKLKMLIENLGGSKLYGEDNMLLVALRELIQNARDAIHARQKLEDSFDNGKITIRLKKEGTERFIEVEDNGIGMSMDCIKHNLLDFGNSYWKSPLSKYENPGLRSKGFTSIGKYGIGFYSVFMVAESVVVRTKRYDKGNKAMKVEFPTGLTLSPIISKDDIAVGVYFFFFFFFLRVPLLRRSSGVPLRYSRKSLN